MAARAPTTFNTYDNLTDLMPRKDVLTTNPSNITDDQQFVLNKEELIWSEMWQYCRSDNVGWFEICRHFMIGRDMCGNGALAAGTQENWAWTFYGWSDPATDFEIRLSNVGLATTSTIAVVADHATHKWHAYGSLQCDVDGSENELKLEGRRTGGLVDYFYVMGIGVFSA